MQISVFEGTRLLAQGCVSESSDDTNFMQLLAQVSKQQDTSTEACQVRKAAAAAASPSSHHLHENGCHHLAVG